MAERGTAALKSVQSRAPQDAAAAFAEHILSTRFTDLPAAVVAATKRSILDTLGVMMAGSSTRSARAILRMLDAWGGAASATVLGAGGLRLPPPSAAFANGAMAHQFDFDDTHDAAVAHPTANSLAAALALAEGRAGCSGRDLITAIAVANDITCRLGLAIRGALYEYPFTRPPIVGIYGATAAAAAILGLPHEKIEWAFGLTLHQTANTLECVYAQGSDVRGLRDGFSARNGVTAALMAHEGVHGDRSSFEGRFGLFNAYFRGEYDRAILTDALGTRFEGANVSIKPWPSARETHATIQAVINLRQEATFAPEEIANVNLAVGKTNLEFCEPGDARRRPVGRMDALSSLPYAVAVALVHGSVALNAYQDEALGDPRVLAVAKLITWELDERFNEDGTIESGRVRVTLRDGRVIEGAARHGLGHPDHPLPPDLLRRKFLGCAQLAAQPLAPPELERLIAVIERLEEHTVADLSAALGVHKPEGRRA